MPNWVERIERIRGKGRLRGDGHSARVAVIYSSRARVDSEQMTNQEVTCFQRPAWLRSRIRRLDAFTNLFPFEGC